MGAWLYTRGVPSTIGRPLRLPMRSHPDPRRAEAAAAFLGRPVRYVDMYRFQREVIAATVSADGRPLAYVESQARQDRGGGVEVSFHLLIRDPDGSLRGTGLQSYNPYFGCEIGYLEWVGEVAVLIYREKRHTYVCRVGPGLPVAFVPITDDWSVQGDVLSYLTEGEATARQLLLPGFMDLSAEEQID